MATSCWQRFQAPLYFAASVLLAVVAISTVFNSTSNTATTTPFMSDHIFNASRCLIKSGFHITATLLQVSPEIFVSNPNSTIFAIKDPAIFNTTPPLSPILLNKLIQYHVLPFKYSFQDLLTMRPNTCLPTLLPGRYLTVTNVDLKSRTVDINNAPISFPDLFLGGRISIHGLLAPFSISSPTCDSKNASHLSPPSLILFKEAGSWEMIVRFLTVNGFVPFAIGLHSVLEEVVRDYEDLKNVTIFAPLDFSFATFPLPELGRIVRLHIVPERFSYGDLERKKGRLGTLVCDLEITGRSRNLTAGRVGIGGVEITVPDVFSSENFVIHGISKALDLPRSNL